MAQLADFYSALKSADDFVIASKLRALAKTAKVKTPLWRDLVEVRPHFIFTTDVYDADGGLVAHRESQNLVTQEGLGYLLGSAFQVIDAATEKANFYLTLVKSDTTPSTTDTASSPGAPEIVYSTDVSQTVSPPLTLGALTTGSDTVAASNATALATFNFLTSITVFGIELFSVNSGGTSNGYVGDILYAYSLFSEPVEVFNGYTARQGATISCIAG
jgi:hypothetical protein